MNIQAGKYYQNSKGLIRKVKGIEMRPNRYGSWEEVVYAPILPGGKEGAEKTCALSTMKGWAKREFDRQRLNGEARSVRKRPYFWSN
ncbi:hypothetical protein EDM56_10585 [Brevibacillus fluminis]|uniref:Uncharacterized protein n=1 Tax=Brevibacillus fluminis TaxID=511487 RepID=A0A3M8DNG4_9BACL|nr:hypothetical protein [Brevibacillus fluminis]RNB89623.1 hypothetical protein EDM56_10585 [Brevibacillus fluminis]